MVLERPFPTYPQGFPPEVLRPVRRRRGPQGARQPAGLGHGRHRGAGRRARGSGRPIVYTSADSVFQIACHEDVSPWSSSTRWCEIARGHPARPARRRAGDRAGRSAAPRAPTGAPLGGATSRCRPPGPPTSICCMSAACRSWASARSARSSPSEEWTWTITPPTTTRGIAACRRHLSEMQNGLLFANLVDFDQVWGHRNDVEGFAAGLRP